MTSYLCLCLLSMRLTPYMRLARVLGRISISCAPSLMVPPSPARPRCSGSRSTTGWGVEGSSSVEFAPSNPATYLAKDTEASWNPKQIPRKGMERRLA